MLEDSQFLALPLHFPALQVAARSTVTTQGRNIECVDSNGRERESFFRLRVTEVKTVSVCAES